MRSRYAPKTRSAAIAEPPIPQTATELISSAGQGISAASAAARASSKASTESASRGSGRGCRPGGRRVRRVRTRRAGYPTALRPTVAPVATGAAPSTRAPGGDHRAVADHRAGGEGAAAPISTPAPTMASSTTASSPTLAPAPTRTRRPARRRPRARPARPRTRASTSAPSATSAPGPRYGPGTGDSVSSAAVQHVVVGGEVRRRRADVAPVAVAGEAVEGAELGEHREDLALDGARAARRDPLQHGRRQQVGAGVDAERLARAQLVRARLLDERLDRRVVVQAHQAEGARVLHRRQRDHALGAQLARARG